jgi:hypothetical protein
MLFAVMLVGGLRSEPALAAEPPAGETAGIDVVECLVYPVEKPTVTFDCTDNLRKLCFTSRPCDVVIGLALTDGRQIDGNAQAWKKVRVRYRCGAAVQVVGPYEQSEHATIRLSCE